MVGFVGLIVPHILRPAVGHSPRRLLIVSGLGGAALTLAADILVRFIATGQGLQLGVLTALLGAPFFILLVFKLREDN